VIPFPIQQAFAQRAKEDGAEFTTRELKSGHSPFLSRPEETAEVLLEAVDAFVR